MDVDHDHPLQSRHLNLDDPVPRRRALAARAKSLAASLDWAYAAARDPEIGVPFPGPEQSGDMRQWAVNLERANGTEETRR